MSEERFRQLEEKIAYLERHVIEQDKAMLELGDELRRVTRELKTLRDQRSARSDVGGEGGEGGDEMPDERPPHY